MEPSGVGLQLNNFEQVHALEGDPIMGIRHMGDLLPEQTGLTRLPSH